MLLYIQYIVLERTEIGRTGRANSKIERLSASFFSGRTLAPLLEEWAELVNKTYKLSPRLRTDCGKLNTFFIKNHIQNVLRNL